MITMSQTKSANYLFIIGVLKSMREGGMITLAEYERAKRYYQTSRPSPGRKFTKFELPPIAGYHPIRLISRTPTPTRSGSIPASFREKKSGNWWRYSLTKGSLA